MQDVEVVKRPEGGAPIPLPVLNVTALQAAASKKLEVLFLHVQSIKAGLPAKTAA